MEWIKAKYDRVLLGFCGLVALIVGGLLLMNTLGWKKKFPNSPDAVGNRSNFGTGDAGTTIDSALTRLKTVATVQPPVKTGIPISLFNSAPIMKVAGKQGTIEVIGGEPIRPPVPNRWLYDNGLDLRQVNILDVDSDNDKFTNLEEFNADPKTNPRDAASHPPVSAKIQYKEVIQDKFSIRMNAYTSPTEITFRVTTADPATSYTTKFLAPGGKIQSARGGEDRFTVLKIDGTVPGKEFAFLEDIKSGKKDIKAVIKEDVNFPTNRARIVCTLGKEEEKVVSKGEEISFEVDPEQKYTVMEITPTEITLEYTPKGTSEKKPLVIKILPPP